MWPNQLPEPMRLALSVVRVSVFIRRAVVPTWLSFFR